MANKETEEDWDEEDDAEVKNYLKEFLFAWVEMIMEKRKNQRFMEETVWQRNKQ